MNRNQDPDGKREASPELVTDQKRRVVQVFGKYADRYVSSESHALGADLQRMAAYLRPVPGDMALDVATGGGHTANVLAPLVRHVTALDLTRPMLEAAHRNSRELGISNVLFTIGDAESLPFPDESFDLVTCRIAPHHFSRPDKFVREAARVLKPGGRFGLTDNVAPESAAAADFINGVEKLRDASHVRCLTPSAWIRQLESAGLILMREEKWKKILSFADWVARTAETQEQRTAVAQRLLSAPEELADQFGIVRRGGQVISLELEQWMAISQKPGETRTRAPEDAVSPRDIPRIVGLDHAQVAGDAR